MALFHNDLDLHKHVVIIEGVQQVYATLCLKSQMNICCTTMVQVDKEKMHNKEYSLFCSAMRSCLQILYAQFVLTSLTIHLQKLLVCSLLLNV